MLNDLSVMAMNDVTPVVSKLFIYPLKSFDKVNVGSVKTLKSGALEYDRMFAFVDGEGQFINGKRQAKIHQIRSKFNLNTQNLSVWVQDTEQVQTFNLGAKPDQAALMVWLSDYFGFAVRLKQDLETGFPDDLVSPGPTIVSTATLEAVARWYPDLGVEEVRRRFRSNIEIAGVPAFWEDHLFGASDHPVSFQVGKVKFLGINPCQRCVVITRDSQTGVADAGFQKTFIQQRQANLPVGVEIDRFNHYFRLAVNTRLPRGEAGKIIHVGDPVQILGAR
jgi:uncharacterized protein